MGRARSRGASTRRRTHRTAVDEADLEAAEAAESAGLRYVTDAMPGISRRRRGRGFEYRDARGRLITDEAELARVRAIAVPPAWSDVWISPSARSHILATGRDARGRKQYRYHPRWREVRDANKYERLAAFGEALPALRQRIDEDLNRPGLPREKVVAAVVRLMDQTLIRVGNDAYARDNDTYGLTTIRSRHVQLDGHEIRFRFKGKGGKTIEIDVRDRRAAAVVRRCQELPGQELFASLDEDGTVRDIGSEHVNDYLREATGKAFTAKDFRTWGGTVLALRALLEVGDYRSQRKAKRNVRTAIEAVAHMLGNTVAVCQRCYVHPVIVDAYVGGELLEPCRRMRARRTRWLRRDEVMLRRLLAHLARARGRRAAA